MANLITILLSALAGMGVGSGGLYLLWLKEGAGYEAQTAFFINLLFFIFALTPATVIHLRKKRIDLRFLLEISLFGIPGVLIGRMLEKQISQTVLSLFLALLLIFSGVFVLIISKKTKEKQKESPHALDKAAKKDYNDY